MMPTIARATVTAATTNPNEIRTWSEASTAGTAMTRPAGTHRRHWASRSNARPSSHTVEVATSTTAGHSNEK